MYRWHVKFYYLATGMEGAAQERDHGEVDAPSATEAKRMIIVRDYKPKTVSEAAWVSSCLTAKRLPPPPVVNTLDTLVEVVLPSRQKLRLSTCTIEKAPYVRVALGGENVLYVKRSDFDKFTVALAQAYVNLEE